MEESSGKVQAHPRSRVVMDIAAFKVRHSVDIVDIDATALRAARARSSSIGAMEELSQKVQNASTHILRRRNHEHAHSNQVSSVGQFKGEFKGQCGAMEEMS